MSGLVCTAIAKTGLISFDTCRKIYGGVPVEGAAGCSPSPADGSGGDLPEHEDGDASWQCQLPGNEPSCYVDHNYTATITPGSESVDHLLLVGLNYNIRPDQGTKKLQTVFRTNQDWPQASRQINNNSGRMCFEGHIYREANSAPMFVQGYDNSGNYWEAGPYEVTVPPPSAIPPVCTTARSALEAFQIAMADPFYLHQPVVDESGNRLIFFPDKAYSGAFFKEGTVTMDDLNGFEVSTGVHPAVVVVYTDQVSGFPRESVDNIVAFGSIPFIKYMPMDWNRPTEDVYPMENYPRGDYDTDLTAFIEEVRATPGPVIVALANEVNLPDKFPYSRPAEVFVPAAQHFFDLAAALGVNNFNGDINLNNWPFSDYQNYIFEHQLLAAVSIDGFNYGAQPSSCGSYTWQSFDDIFKRAFLEADCYYPNIQFTVGEFSTSSAGGDKAAWYCEAFTKIKQYPLSGMVVFSFSKPEGDCGVIDWDIRE